MRNIFCFFISISILSFSQSSYQFATLKYSGGGDWYANPSSLKNLAIFCNKNLNMNFLIAKNNNEYISKAVELSSNLDKYLKLRKQVYEKSLKSPLFDAESYSKNFYKSLEEIIK